MAQVIINGKKEGMNLTKWIPSKNIIVSGIQNLKKLITLFIFFILEIRINLMLLVLKMLDVSQYG